MSDYIKIMTIKIVFFLIRVTFVVLAAYQHPLLVIPSYLLVEIASKMAFGDLGLKIVYYTDDIMDDDINQVKEDVKEEAKEDVKEDINQEINDVVQNIPVEIKSNKSKSKATQSVRVKKSSASTSKKQVGAKRIVDRKKPKN